MTEKKTCVKCLLVNIGELFLDLQKNQNANSLIPVWDRIEKYSNLSELAFSATNSIEV